MRRIGPIFLLLIAGWAWCQNVNLGQLKLPPGFRISIFAQTSHPRMMVLSPGGVLLATSTSDGKVFAFPDPHNSGKAEKIVTVLEGLNEPHGIAFYEGKLYVAETDKVVRYDWNEQQVKATNAQTLAKLPRGGGHSTRTLLFTNGKMYVSIGSSCNNCVEKDSRRATVLEMNPDGSGERIFARGLRNAVGMALNPKTNTIWATENGRDNMGDNVPPDEINDLGKDGGDFGWPYCYGERAPDPAFKSEAPRCKSTIPALVNLQAHSAPLGLAFYSGNMFPPEYQNSLYVAYHGSWNRTARTGYKIVRIKLKATGAPDDGPQDFITGWLQGGDNVMGRPVGILFGKDGSMFITDDHGEAIYRVTYGK